MAHVLMQFEQPAGHAIYHVIARYLVCSRGELLMVARFGRHVNAMTRCFKLYRRVPDALSGGPIGNSWQEIESLDGRAIFVGRGCSVSYEHAQHPAFPEGVYFLDDSWLRTGARAAPSRVEPRFACNDYGTWSPGGDPTISRWPVMHRTSSYSPSLWFYP